MVIEHNVGSRFKNLLEMVQEIDKIFTQDFKIGLIYSKARGFSKEDVKELF